MEYPIIRFVFDLKKKASKTTKGSVQMVVTFHGQRRYVSTGVTLYSDQWDERSMVKNTPDANILNQRLNKTRGQLLAWLEDLEKQGQSFEFSKLERYLNTQKTASCPL